MAPGEETAVNPVIGEPPSPFAVKATLAEVLPGTATPIVGATGTVGPTPAVGVTLFEGAEATPMPTAELAVTVNVYAVPFASPGTVIGDAAPVAWIFPGFEVTV